MEIIVNKSSLEDTKKYFAIKQVFKFEELTEEQKKKALYKLSDINVDHDWWQSTYDDAEEIGLKITSFNLDRNRNATGEFSLSACEVAQNVFNEHGEDCETYKTAQKFIEVWQPIFDDYMDENSENYESQELENTLQEMEDDFLNSLIEDYSIILQKECEYLQSDEAIIETINFNEYFFDEEGNLI